MRTSSEECHPTPRPPRYVAASPLASIVVILAALGWVTTLLGVGPESWPILLGWLGGIALTATAWRLGSVTFRVGVAGTLVVSCLALTWVGGLFFLPSALALLVLAVRSGTETGATS